MYRAAGFREKYCCKEYFLFRNLKDILFDQFRKRLLLQIEEDSSSDLKIRDDFTREVRSIFYGYSDPRGIWICLYRFNIIMMKEHLFVCH